MEFCHKNPTLPSPTLEKLGQFVLEWQTRWEETPPDFERFEHELHERIMLLECELLTAELARYDVDVEQLEVGGVTYRQTLTASETYLSAAGPLSVERHLYRPAGRGSRSICPGVASRDDRRLLDAVGGSASGVCDGPFDVWRQCSPVCRTGWYGA